MTMRWETKSSDEVKSQKSDFTPCSAGKKVLLGNDTAYDFGHYTVYRKESLMDRKIDQILVHNNEDTSIIAIYTNHWKFEHHLELAQKIKDLGFAIKVTLANPISTPELNRVLDADKIRTLIDLVDSIEKIDEKARMHIYSFLQMAYTPGSAQVDDVQRCTIDFAAENAKKRTYSFLQNMGTSSLEQVNKKSKSDHGFESLSISDEEMVESAFGQGSDTAKRIARR